MEDEKKNIGSFFGTSWVKCWMKESGLILTEVVDENINFNFG